MQRALLLLDAQDFQHVFRRQRLEIETVGRVIIGRDRFRVAVDHDGFIVGIAKREGRMAAAIIELDALADTVRAAAENDDLLAIRNFGFRARLADERRLIGRVHIGGRRSEFGGAGIDALIDRMHVEIGAQLGHVFGVLGRQACKAGIGEAHGFQHAQVFRILRQSVFADALFGLYDGFDLFKEPRIDLRCVMHLLDAKAEAHGLCDHAQAVRRRRADGGADCVLLVAFLDVGNSDFIKARQAGFQTAQCLLQAFLEGTANSHHFADRLHGGGQDRR